MTGVAVAGVAVPAVRVAGVAVGVALRGVGGLAGRCRPRRRRGGGRGRCGLGCPGRCGGRCGCRARRRGGGIPVDGLHLEVGLGGVDGPALGLVVRPGLQDQGSRAVGRGRCQGEVLVPARHQGALEGEVVADVPGVRLGRARAGGQPDGVAEAGVQAQVGGGAVAQQPVGLVRPLLGGAGGAGGEHRLRVLDGLLALDADAQARGGIVQPPAQGALLGLARPGPGRVTGPLTRVGAGCVGGPARARRRGAVTGVAGGPQHQREHDQAADGEDADGEVAAPGRTACRLVGGSAAVGAGAFGPAARGRGDGRGGGALGGRDRDLGPGLGLMGPRPGPGRVRAVGDRVGRRGGRGGRSAVGAGERFADGAGEGDGVREGLCGTGRCGGGLTDRVPGHGGLGGLARPVLRVVPAAPAQHRLREGDAEPVVEPAELVGGGAAVPAAFDMRA